MIGSVSDLMQLCSTFCGDAFPSSANSFFDFGCTYRDFALGTFAVESDRIPSVIFRECQSLAICTASALSDEATLAWDLSGGAHRVAAGTVRDLVVGLVLGDLALADYLFGLDVQNHQVFPPNLEVMWSGFSISFSDIPTVCGVAEGRLWLRIDDQDEVLSVAP